MNAKRKIKAVQDNAEFKNLPIDELTLHLVDAGYDEFKEVPELIQELQKEESDTNKFDLESLYKIDRNELGELVAESCPEWKEYQKLAEQYNGSKMIDYIKVNAVGKFKTIFNSKNQPVSIMVGIQTVKSTIEGKTRITPVTANDLNAQIWSNNPPHGSYYYLIAELINY